ncbi:TPA: Arc family DNA-binding protein [Proteus mirabilis]
MSEQESKEFIERFTVRMPTGMREEIAKIADKNGRSMNSEIIKILQEAIDKELHPEKCIPDETLAIKLNKMTDTLNRLELMFTSEKEAKEAGLVITRGEKK